jgi:16S rRNA (guanine966-N2)-methyltransferase
VREATFNALHSLGGIVGASVGDVFAGSGALGIEALSRGASRATFVDHDGAALDAVRRNLDATGLVGRATVVPAETLRWLATATTTFDLVLVDPPYDTGDEQWHEVLAAVVARTAPGGLVVAESDRPVVVGGNLGVLRTKRYGGTVVTIARAAPGANPPTGAER